jgi:hypothetical protein
MNIKESVVEELTRLNRLNGRIPFTHHHDYVRLNADQARFMSRSEVAELEASEDELYACAFLQAVESLTTEQKICSDISKALYYTCLQIAVKHVTDLDAFLKKEFE